MRDIDIWRDNEERLRQVWARIEANGGAKESYPQETHAAFYLETCLEYKIERRILERLVARGEFIPPQKQLGRMAWTKADILRLACVLEQRRSFQPFSGRRTEAEREIETKRLFDGLDAMQADPSFPPCKVTRERESI